MSAVYTPVTREWDIKPAGNFSTFCTRYIIMTVSPNSFHLKGIIFMFLILSETFARKHFLVRPYLQACNLKDK